MKKDYLTLIRKSDFTDLFKFGSLFIDAESVVEFDGDCRKLSNNTAARDAVFKRLNQFDYSFTVLLAYIRSNHVKEDGKVDIDEVEGIFALDEEAKHEIEITYDQRIKINDPVWPEITRRLQERFFYADAKKGPRNIWQIVNIDLPLSKVDWILPDDAIRELAYEVINDKRPSGNLSFWVYLLRYERHAPFPKNAIGIVMDAINVCINVQAQMELEADSVFNTGIYQLLENYTDRNLKLPDLQAELERFESGLIFFNRINELAFKGVPVKCHLAIQIALLFLAFKYICDDEFDLQKYELLKSYAGIYPDAYYFALYLLGIYLGNTHTQDSLYDSLPLPIFRLLGEKDQASESTAASDKGDDLLLCVQMIPYKSLLPASVGSDMDTNSHKAGWNDTDASLPEPEGKVRKKKRRSQKKKTAQDSGRLC